MVQHATIRSQSRQTVLTEGAERRHRKTDLAVAVFNRVSGQYPREKNTSSTISVRVLQLSNVET
jgi:hypothetical protein